MRIAAIALGLAALLTVPALLPPAQAAKKVALAGKKAHSRVAHKRKPAGPPPTPARVLFGAVKTPAPMPARAIGFYAKGCLAGAEALPIDGPGWQVMRLSRNRNWGHPDMIAFLEKFAADAKDYDGWPGILVGDISQPRGGPMVSSHASHQIGLDADIWFTPMPDHRLTAKEREELSATSMLAEDRVSVDPKKFTEADVKLLKRAASYPQVHFVLVNPAIKKAVCEMAASEKDSDWMRKVRPYWGHDDHFHIRIQCPKGSTSCESQAPIPANDNGCGATLTAWLKRVKPAPAVAVAPPVKPAKPAHPKPGLTLAQLPAACRMVLNSGNGTPVAQPAAKPAPAAKQGKATAKKTSAAQ
jgi:penicillin-insensitive murein endopeptidase